MDEKELLNNSPWRMTQIVDSKWAGTVQIKYDSAKGDSFHIDGGGVTQTTWKGALTNLRWVKIANPAGGFKEGPQSIERFKVYPHIVFGDDLQDHRKRHGVFMIDTYSGAAYVLATHFENNEIPPYHDIFSNCFWKEMRQSSEADDGNKFIGRYELAVSNAEWPLEGGKLGPFVTKLDRLTGKVEIAIPSGTLTPEDPTVKTVDLTWYTTED